MASPLSYLAIALFFASRGVSARRGGGGGGSVNCDENCGQTIGIVVGVILGSIILLTCISCYIKRNKQANAKTPSGIPINSTGKPLTVQQGQTTKSALQQYPTKPVANPPPAYPNSSTTTNPSDRGVIFFFTIVPTPGAPAPTNYAPRTANLPV